MNPFDLRGPDFLLLYVFSLAIAAAVAYALRQFLRAPGDSRFPAEPLDAYHVATLRGGPRRAAEAAIASVVHRGSLSVDRATGQLVLTGSRPREAHPAEDAVYLSFSGTRATARAKDLRSAVSREVEPLVESLSSRGLAPTPGRAAAIQILPAIPFLLLLVAGALKVSIGLSRNRPVGLLLTFMALTGGAALWFGITPARSTRRGAAYLDFLRRRNAALRTASARPTSMLSPADVATAVALFGLDSIAYGRLADLALALYPPKDTRSNSDSCGSSCSSSSSCGSSGCGGGGGCGGCGS